MNSDHITVLPSVEVNTLTIQVSFAYIMIMDTCDTMASKRQMELSVILNHSWWLSINELGERAKIQALMLTLSKKLFRSAIVRNIDVTSIFIYFLITTRKKTECSGLKDQSG